VIAAIAIGAVLLLCLALVVAVARDRGPGPDDVAVSYELAWDRLDFDALWTLSGTELRDGLDKHEFVAAKRAAYEQQRALRGLVEHVGIEDVAVTSGSENALVTTRVELRDGTVGRAQHRAARAASITLAGRRVPARTHVVMMPRGQPCWVVSATG
jgi:hypothetical protein